MSERSTHANEPMHRLGIWIDHDVARFVELVGPEIKYSEIHSEIESRHRSTGGLRFPGKSYMKSFTASEKSRTRARQEHMRRFYQQVIGALRDADTIAILGPGAAKRELADEIRRHKDLDRRLCAVETAQDMTEAQLVAKVKTLLH